MVKTSLKSKYCNAKKNQLKQYRREGVTKVDNGADSLKNLLEKLRTVVPTMSERPSKNNKYSTLEVVIKTIEYIYVLENILQEENICDTLQGIQKLNFSATC